MAGAESVAAPARRLGIPLATMLVAGNMIASGIFLLPATLAPFGGLALIGWGIATVGALALAVTFAALADRRPLAGGLIAQCGDAFGPVAGLVAAFGYWLSVLVSNVAIASAIASYLSEFLPTGGGPFPGAVIIAALIVLLTLVGLAGAVSVGRFAAVSLLIGLVPILAVGVFGWFRFDPETFLRSWHAGRATLPNLPQTVILAFWAFVGLETASIASGSLRDRRRTTIIATVAGVSFAALIYVSASAAILGLIPTEDLSHSAAPFADAVRRLTGTRMASFVALCAIVKALGTLGGMIFIAIECGTAVGVRDPRFARLIGGAGRRSIALANMGVMLLIVWGVAAFSLAEAFATLIEIATVLTLAIYALACAAALRFERAAGGRVAIFTVSAVGFAFCIMLMASAGWLALILSMVALVMTGAVAWTMHQPRR